MQLRDIQYVIAAAEAGSFSKSALVVHVSQPALSQMIQRLEDELGVKLFIRKSNKVILTEEGAIFCEEGREILNRSQHLISRMGEFKELTQGKLSIAIAPFYQKNFLLPFLAEFRKKYPGIMVQVVDAFSNYSEELLMNGEVDLALVMLPFHSGTIRYEPLYREQIYLAVPKHSDVCQKLGGSESRELETEDLRKLQEEPFILYERGRRMYESSQKLCRSAGFVPKAAFLSNSCESLNAMVGNGMGIGFVPSSVEKTANHEEIVYYSINSPDAIRTLAVGYLEKNLSAAAQEFVKMAKKQNRITG